MYAVLTSAYLTKLMERAYRAGYTECQHILAPLSDEVRRTDVKEWLASLGLDYRLFLRLKRDGEIRPFHKGKCANSAVYYWRSEIIKAFDKALTAKDAPNEFKVFEQQELVEGIMAQRRLRPAPPGRRR